MNAGGPSGREASARGKRAAPGLVLVPGSDGWRAVMDRVAKVRDAVSGVTSYRKGRSGMPGRVK